MFTDEGFAQAQREEQAAGAVPERADLFSSGTLATAPDGHGTQFGLDIETLTGPHEAEAWVDARVDAGADYIKVVIRTGASMGIEYASLGDETVRAVIDAAHARDLQVVTHVQTLDAARHAVEAGTDGLAHMFVDEAPPDAFIQRLVEEDVFVISTLSVFQRIGGGEPPGTSIVVDADLEPFLTAADRQSVENAYSGYEGLSLSTAQEGLRRMHEAGVPILAGTDAPNPGTAHGASLHRELELLVDAGLAPREALAAATSVPARIFGLGDRGRLEEGMRADLLLVEGDARVAFGSEWTATTDAQAGGDSVASLEVVEGGPNDSRYALEVRGEVREGFVAPWAGAMFMPGAQPFAPADLSNQGTLHFHARGEAAGTYRLQVFCQNLGQAPAERAFEVTESWLVVSNGARLDRRLRSERATGGDLLGGPVGRVRVPHR